MSTTLSKSRKFPRIATISLLNTVLLPTLLLVALQTITPVDRSALNHKVLIGYQGWFTCPSDGSNRWTHWFRNTASPETQTVDLYPDTAELDPDERCEIPGMTIAGKPAWLFSSRNPKTVSRHFRWMRDYGLDGVLVQRFVGEIRRKQQDGDIVLKNIMAAAAESGRTFAIEYDISGASPATFAQTIKDDWQYLTETLKVVQHPNYQHHAGKPVVSVWGMGLSDGDAHPPADPEAALALINWFKARATYMGGTPAHWATLTADSRKEPVWAGVYADMDVIQPWNVGRYGTLAAVDKWKEDVLVPDIKLTAANHQLYMPVVFPGFSWHNLKPGAKENQIPRLGGEFLWRQAYNAKLAGATMLKIAMFDEADEGTAIMKAASHRNQAPDQGYWLTLDADGNELPNDFYLRVAGQITRMFHGETADIEKVRQRALAYTSALPDFICTQETRRDTAKSAPVPQWKLSDTLTIQLSYFGQKENYKVVAIDGKPTSKPIGRVGGNTSLGDFGSTLHSIFTPQSQAAFKWERYEGHSQVFSFHIPLEHSTFTTWFNTFLKSRSTKWAVKGEVFIDPETLETVRITFESDGMPGDFPVRKVETVLDYDHQKVAGREYLLPRQSVNITTFNDGHAARSDMQFTDYKKFTADTGITFDAPQ